MPVILAIASFFGISPLRLIIYAALFVAATGGTVALRQHYVNKGYASAIAAVKKQDDRAAAAAAVVESKANACTDTNGYWDVITQGCKLDDAP